MLRFYDFPWEKKHTLAVHPSGICAGLSHLTLAYGLTASLLRSISCRDHQETIAIVRLPKI